MITDEDFLDAIGSDEQEEQVTEPAVEPAPEPEAPVVEEPVNPLVAPVVEAKPDPGFVPITAVLDERDKRQKLEAELAQYRAQQQQPQAVPDKWEDPDAYEAFRDQKLQHELYQQNLRWSERIATSEHGAETVKTAKEWAVAKCDEDPYFNAKVAASPDPIGFAVSEWRREQIASQVTPEDLSAFQAWKQAQAQIQANPTPPAPNVPPRSLASAPSAGSVMLEPELSDADIFEETFQRK